MSVTAAGPIASAIAGVLLLGLLGLLVSLNLTERSRLVTTQRDIDKLDRQLRVIWHPTK